MNTRACIFRATANSDGPPGPMAGLHRNGAGEVRVVIGTRIANPRAQADTRYISVTWTEGVNGRTVESSSLEWERWARKGGGEHTPPIPTLPQRAPGGDESQGARVP